MKKNKPVPKSAREKAMDLLAVREHSRHELEQKLAAKKYTKEEIEAALTSLESAGWLPDSKELALRVAETLHRKAKSHMYIVEYLKSKGLPPVPRDSEFELEKAQKLLQSHFSKLSKSSEADKKQIAQFLKNRGFDTETILSVCK